MLSSLAALSGDFMSKQMPSQKVEPQGENFASCFVGSRLEEVLLKKKKTEIIRNQQTAKKSCLIFFARQIDAQSKQVLLFVIFYFYCVRFKLMPGTNLERMTSAARVCTPGKLNSEWPISSSKTCPGERKALEKSQPGRNKSRMPISFNGYLENLASVVIDQFIWNYRWPNGLDKSVSPLLIY